MARELVIRQLQAAQLHALTQAVKVVPPARRRGTESPDPLDAEQNSAWSISSQKLVASRLAPEFTCHPRSMAAEIAVAVGLTQDLPRIMSLLDQGRLDLRRASLITRKLHEACDELPDLEPGDESWLLLEALLAGQAPGLTYGQLERLIEQLLLQLEPDGGAARHTEALRGRHVDIEARPDGMALVTALISAETGQLLDGFLDAAADAARDQAEADGVPDGRTHAQRRADVLAALVQALSEGVDIPLVPDPRNEVRDDPCEDPGSEDESSGERVNSERDRAHSDGEDRDGEDSDRGNSDRAHSDRGNSDRGDQHSEERDSAEGDSSSESSTGPNAHRSSGTNADASAKQQTEQTSNRKTTEDDPAASSAPTSDSPHRRPEEQQDADEVRRQESFTRLGFPPVPSGLVPAWWRLRDLPRSGRRGPHLVVTITDTTLLGLDNIPGLLQGHGVITAEQARRLAVAPGQVTLMVLPGACTHDHAGTAVGNADSDVATDQDPGASPGTEPACPIGLDHNQAQVDRYRPGRTLFNQVTARYPVCTFPGCTTPASKCDLDHLKPFQQGGLSCACNLHPACRGHHRLKTFAEWHARLARPEDLCPPGTIIWTTPDGAEHSSPPPRLPGMPGWSLPTRAPSLPDADGTFSRTDLMSSAERTARRTRSWLRQLQWQADQKDRSRRAAARQAKQAAQALQAAETAKTAKTAQAATGPHATQTRTTQATTSAQPTQADTATQTLQAATAAQAVPTTPAAARPALARPPHAPWGEPTGTYPEYGEPPF
ncbi:DUF222 domain-containing protein [Kineosporia sp. NBRC 101677]|uniref:HNH endonuclease signature motif containing protein n=1 Tax=Kineosporia sp. NBRC 101677 TaxID=3032197 RepID=UPI002554C49A|nr:DUF222 domain-containing protein [Kineosporia sp. NBRC 101677]